MDEEKPEFTFIVSYIVKDKKGNMKEKKKQTIKATSELNARFKVFESLTSTMNRNLFEIHDVKRSKLLRK